MIDLHSVVAFFHKANWTELAITHEINRVLGENTISYSTVGKYVRKFVLAAKEADTPILSTSDADFSLDDRIALVLSEEPFLSTRQIAHKVMMSKSTVHRHLTQSMRWKLRHLKWVPHTLTESEKVTRVQRTTELLGLLQSIKHQGWQYIVTLDESWFYWEIDWEQQWLPEDDEPGTRTRRGIDRKKTMLTIVWNTRGFHVIDAMPRGETFSARYYIDHILTPICRRLIPTGRRKLVIHADNSRCHTAKVVLDFVSQNGVRVAPHPPYSPDIAPSDFFLFGYLKHELRGSCFHIVEELLAGVRALLSQISPETLLGVFDEWIARCERVIANDGDYFE
jgi:transposase